MRKIIVILLVFSSLFSCTKEEVATPVPSPVVSERLDLSGKWLLISGYMYMDNVETGEKVRYSHFGSGQTTSSLRYGGAEFNIEKLNQNVTTWSFYDPKASGDGKFILNGDSLSPYGLSITYNNWTIIEAPNAGISNIQMGGSSRPIAAYTDDYVNKIGVFRIQDGYCSINGVQWTYHSELTLKKIVSW